MKKTRQFLFSFLAFVLLVWSGVVKGQVSSLPYQTDFSSQGDWVLDNGECTNIWHIGNATGYNSALIYLTKVQPLIMIIIPHQEFSQRKP